MKIGPGDFGPNLDLYTIGERSSSSARPRRRGWQPGCAWGGGSCARARRVPDLPRGLLSWCSGLRSRVGGLGEEVLMQRGRQVGQATPYADDSGAHVGTPLTTHTSSEYTTPPLIMCASRGKLMTAFSVRLSFVSCRCRHCECLMCAYIYC